jgi:hypothetical protein
MATALFFGARGMARKRHSGSHSVGGNFDPEQPLHQQKAAQYLKIHIFYPADYLTCTYLDYP